MRLIIIRCALHSVYRRQCRHLSKVTDGILIANHIQWIYSPTFFPMQGFILFAIGRLNGNYCMVCKIYIFWIKSNPHTVELGKMFPNSGVNVQVTVLCKFQVRLVQWCCTYDLANFSGWSLDIFFSKIKLKQGLTCDIWLERSSCMD